MSRLEDGSTPARPADWTGRAELPNDLTHPGHPDGSELDSPSGVRWRFEAGHIASVERWLLGNRMPGSLRAMRGPAREISDHYVDTPDWRIHQSGYKFRTHREGDIAQLTLEPLRNFETGRRSREISQALSIHEIQGPSFPPGPVSERVRAVAGREPLRILMVLQTRRLPFNLLDGPREIGEILLDDTTIMLPGAGRMAWLPRIEIISRDRSLAGLEPLVDALLTECDLRIASQSKYEAALQAGGLAAPSRPDLGSIETGPEMTSGALAFAVLTRHLRVMMDSEPSARLGEDPEAVHDMRVAIRRLRAALGLFETCLPSDLLQSNDELRWIGRILGEVRDLDVQSDRIARRFRGAEDPSEAEALTSLSSLIRHRRAASRRRMLSALDSPRFERLVDRLAGALRQGRESLPACAAEPAKEMAPGEIKRLHGKVRKAGERVDGGSTAEDIHDLRIRCRRLRYALEFYEPLLGRGAQPVLSALVALQDLLGEHQDAQVAAAYLRRLGTRRRPGLPSATVFVMGAVSQRCIDEADVLRRKLPKLYRRVRGRRWKTLKRLLTADGSSSASRSKARRARSNGEDKTPPSRRS